MWGQIDFNLGPPKCDQSNHESKLWICMIGISKISQATSVAEAYKNLDLTV